MPQRAATIESLPAAFEVVKAMQAQGLDWGEGYRPLGRRALAEIIETEMAAAVDRWLESLEAEDEADRRNGYYRRSLLTELGDIELFVPRTRRYCPTEVLRRLRPAFARDRSDDPGRFRAWTFDPQARRGPAVPARPPGQPCDGEPGGAEPRSCGRGLPRPSGSGPLQGLDARRRRARPQDRRGGAAPPGSGGSGPQAGRQEGSDRLSPGARRKRRRMGTLPRRPLQARLNRRGPRHDLRRRRQGLLAALPMVYDKIPVQRCWAHKIRNILITVRKADEASVKADLHAVMNADTAAKARSAARRFAERWGEAYPAAVACLRDDLDELLTCFRYKTLPERKAVRTTNAIERRFREVRRRTRPMGVFQDRTSMDRILFAVFTHENKMQGIPTLLPLTHNL